MDGTVQTLRFPVFCTACPTADLYVVANEPPDEHGVVARTHVACERCGLGWTYTATCSPMKDHTAIRLGLNPRDRRSVSVS